MPNYNYRCCKCKQITELALPISTDPKKLLGCECGYTMRRVMRVPGAVKGFKTFAGDWFKKTYGHDVGEAYEDKARQTEDRKVLEREMNNEI